MCAEGILTCLGVVGHYIGKLLSDGMGKISLFYIYKFICKFDIVSKIILYFEDCYIIKGREKKGIKLSIGSLHK